VTRASLYSELSNILERLENKVDNLQDEIQQIKVDSGYVAVYVTKVDVPARDVHCKILTDNGLKDAIFRCFTDLLALRILNEYSKGRTKFVFRIYGGQIIEVKPSDYLTGKIEQLSQELNKPNITSRIEESGIGPIDDWNYTIDRLRKIVDHVILADWIKVKYR